MEDNEATFDELQARIAKVIGMLESFKPAQFDGSEEPRDRAEDAQRRACA